MKQGKNTRCGGLKKTVSSDILKEQLSANVPFICTALP